MSLASETAVLILVAGRLESAAIAYMLTGSYAASFYSQPRMTRDLDLVIEPGESSADTFETLFSPDFVLDKSEIAHAIRLRGMFNLIHTEAIVKVDFIVRQEEAYRRVEFERRRKQSVDGQSVWVAAPEDLILSKLAWAKASHSELQLRDVRGLLTSGVALDHGYIEQWAARLGLVALLREARSA